MIFVTVSVWDENGTLCADKTPFVKFSVEGSALKILAADAGDLTSTEPFPQPECRCFRAWGGFSSGAPEWRTSASSVPKAPA